VAEFVLEAVSSLDEPIRQFDGVAIDVVDGYSIVSIGISKSDEKSLKKALSSKFQIDFPAPGQFTTSSSGGKLIGMQPNQLFYLWENAGGGAVETISKKLGNLGYFTDQSDSFVVVSVSGADAAKALAKKALERICPIDLFPDNFPVGSFARTKMEHLGVALMCVGDDAYWLMSARSSAGSFLHAVETSVLNVT